MRGDKQEELEAWEGIKRRGRGIRIRTTKGIRETGRGVKDGKKHGRESRDLKEWRTGGMEGNHAKDARRRGGGQEWRVKRSEVERCKIGRRIGKERWLEGRRRRLFC
jgi:hypothetical protein